ncbi:restriction endonuclease subunit S [Agrilactobacillus composti]|uniref:restriction endonuclease subunit S n=1 Tax=Agrilactobacillus composti TaxID=398555 RepID=UPI0022A9C925|nr:restriction endonuclease subunit S [Agrilactobacillus composti]
MWEQRKLNELSQITDTKHATAPIVNYETQFKMIRTSTVRSGHLHTKMMDSVTYEVYEEWSERIHLKADDVVFSREAPMGESAIIPDNNNKYFLGQRMVGIRTSTSLDPVFLISTFQAPKFRKEILIRNAESTTVANFGIPSIKSYEIDLPQINEQSKISRFFKLIGIIIALHQRKLELLKKLKQGYLQKLLPQDGRKVPKLRFAQFSGDWEKHELASVVKMVRSYPLSREVEWPSDTGYRYIHYGDIHTGKARIITNSSRLPAILGGNYTPLQEGDIIIADASEDYQEIALPAVLISIKNKERVIAGLHTIAFRPSESLNSLFLYYVLTAPTFRYYGYRMGQGLKVFGISKSNVNKFTIFFPSRTEQSKIVNLLYSLNNTIVMIQKEIDNLKEMKKGYLAHLFI